ANLCETSGSTLTITEPGQISITAETPTDISCNGLTDGQIVIAASGGTGTLQYSIDNGTIYQTSGTFSGLAQGTNYQVKVQDANLCETSGSTLTINEPAVINLESSDAVNPTCNGDSDGSIDITISGGTVATVYTYSWSTTDGSGLVTDSEDQTGLSAGTYNVTATDDNSCASAFVITLDDPLEISIDSENSTDASSQTTADGTITVTASGGTGILTYDLNPGDDSNITGIYNSLLPGDYTVDVTDDNSCGPVSSNTITVGYPNAIDDIIISDKIKLYPNPTSAKLNVEIDFEIDDVYKIEILSISGQILFNKEIKSHGITKEELDLSNYPKGVYFIRIYNSQFNFKEKILLQ
ncbi:MAG: T9SS type A sorting domain-containing protein, partial [Bacteroidales bacterium]|nr:T9SS type A sorting domain-containing protein [Bacteroidales bacterium]